MSYPIPNSREGYLSLFCDNQINVRPESQSYLSHCFSLCVLIFANLHQTQSAVETDGTIFINIILITT